MIPPIHPPGRQFWNAFYKVLQRVSRDGTGNFRSGQLDNSPSVSLPSVIPALGVTSKINYFNVGLCLRLYSSQPHLKSPSYRDPDSFDTVASQPLEFHSASLQSKLMPQHRFHISSQRMGKREEDEYIILKDAVWKLHITLTLTLMFPAHQQQFSHPATPSAK